MFWRCTIFRLAKPAFFRYNEEGWFGQPKYSTPPKHFTYVVSVFAFFFFLAIWAQTPVRVSYISHVFRALCPRTSVLPTIVKMLVFTATTQAKARAVSIEGVSVQVFLFGSCISAVFRNSLFSCIPPIANT